MKRHLLTAAVLCTAASFLSIPSAKAAPQILAALPSESGIALVCAEGICVAELSTYCLQRERPAPGMGTAYVPARPEHFTLVLASDNGTEVRVPAGEHMRFTEHRGFMAVAASLELGRLKALGATSAKLVVWQEASLIPVAEANDPNPLSDEEIAFATKSLRTQGQHYVDNKPQAASAQLLAKLNAALPMDGPITASNFEGMWQNAIGDSYLSVAGEVGLNGARDAYNSCAGTKMPQRMDGLKRCLEYKHDNFLRNLNIDYWQNQPGS